MILQCAVALRAPSSKLFADFQAVENALDDIEDQLVNSATKGVEALLHSSVDIDSGADFEAQVGA